jgi:hypothetical protein
MTTLERIANTVGQIEDQTTLAREALGHLALSLIDSDQVMDRSPADKDKLDLMRSFVGEIRDLLKKTSELATNAILETNALRQANEEVA